MIAKHPGECKRHPFQDTTYGNGFRVMNPVRLKGEVVGARCTVCCPVKEPGKKRGGVYDLNQLTILRK